MNEKQWNRWSSSEREDWLRANVWGPYGVTDPECMTRGAPYVRFDEAMMGFVCHVCKPLEWHNTTPRQVIEHIQTEQHQQNITLRKLGGEQNGD